MPTNVLFDPGKFEHLTHLSYEDIGESFFTKGRSGFYHVPSTMNMLLTIRNKRNLHHCTRYSVHYAVMHKLAKSVRWSAGYILRHNVSTVPAISRLEVKVRQQTKQMKIKCYIFDIITVLYEWVSFQTWMC